jgi:hypothetical protein
MATPLTNPKREAAPRWFGLVDKKAGRPRQRMEALARAVIERLPPEKRKLEVKEMRLAVAGWSFGATGAIQVLKAHANDVDEFYWFDPPTEVANSGANRGFLQTWLSRQGSRGPRLLRLMGGIENETFFRLRNGRNGLAKHVKHDNNVSTMVPHRFWENSNSYKLAISVPPPLPKVLQPFPESISCSSTSLGQTGCEVASTSLSDDTGVFLSKIEPGVGVVIVGKDRAGKRHEPPLPSPLSLSELKGLLRFAFLSGPQSAPPNLRSEKPLYEGTGSKRWTLGRLKQELEKIALGSFNGFRHMWTIVGGVYPDGTPSIPTNGPSFRGFLQMCLMEGKFPKR